MNQEELNAKIANEVQEMYDALQSDEVIDDNNEDIFKFAIETAVRALCTDLLNNHIIELTEVREQCLEKMQEHNEQITQASMEVMGRTTDLLDKTVNTLAEIANR